MTRLTAETARSAATYLDDWLEFRQRHLRIPGVQAAVLLDGELVLTTAHGHADLDRGVALTPEHLFRVASHSKTFTATAVLQLAESGALRLDDPVRQWVPRLDGADAGEATLRELLSHTSGVIRDGDDSDHWQLVRPFPDEDGVLALGRRPRIIERNERFKYSNVTYSLLGLVVEAASGQDYRDYVTANVVEPLGLTRTGPELDPSRADDYAAGYSALSYSDRRREIPHVDTYAMAAATGFFSTAEDLCRYFAAHCYGDERLLSDGSKREMQHALWPVAQQKDGRYGLGISVVKVGDRDLGGHGGGYPGHITRTLFDAETGLVASVLTNAIDVDADALVRTVVRLLDLAADPGDPADHAPAPEGAQRFCGRYADLWGVSDVALLGGRLFALDPTADDPVDGLSRLEVVDDTTLKVVGAPGTAAFGELVRYSFDGGRVTSVSGPGGLTSWPIDDFDVDALLARARPTR